MATSVSFDVYAKDRASRTFSSVGSSAEGSEGHLRSFGSTLRKVGEAFAVFEAAKYGVDFLKSSTTAAINDQAAQRKLALALQNTTHANAQQVMGVQDWLTKQSEVYGVSKDDLMPAFQRLAQSTGSVTKAQRELKIAMDVSAGTGKDLTTVSTALMKANNGTTASLSRLGLQTKSSAANTVAIKSAQIAAQSAQLTYTAAVKSYGATSEQARIANEKLVLAQQKVTTAQKSGTGVTLTLNQALHKMSDTFHGQAEVQAKSLQGQTERLSASWHEFQVQVGDKFIPVLTKLGNWFFSQGLPAIEGFGKSLDPVISKFSNALHPALTAVGDYLQANLIPALNQLEPQFVAAEPKIDSLAKAFGKNLVPTLVAMGESLRKSAPQYRELLVAVTAVVPPLAKLVTVALKVAPIWVKINDFMNKIPWLPSIGGATRLVKAIGWLASALIAVGSAFGTATGAADKFANSVDAKVGQAVTYVKSMPGKVKTAAGNLGHLLYGAGQDVVNGLIQGIESKVSGLLSDVGGLAGKVSSAFKKPLGILSPSKVFIGHGANIMEGLIQGIESKQVALATVLSKVTAAVQAAGQKLQAAIQARNSFAQGFQSFSTSAFGADYGTDANGNPVAPTAASIIAYQKQQAKQAHMVKTDVHRLVKMGLSPALIKQLQSEGAAGIPEIQALANATPAQIRQYNHLNKQTSSDLRSAGMSAANRVYGKEIKQDRKSDDEVKNLLKEIRDELKAEHHAGHTVGEFRISGHDLVAILKKQKRTTGASP